MPGYSSFTTEYQAGTKEEKENNIKVFQVPSSEDRARISGKIAWGRDEDPSSPQCPGSQCFSLCCRC
jgi:hypothetical protein